MPKQNKRQVRRPTNLIPWVGGKARIIGRLIPLFPPHKRYVSVFGGSAADLLGKPRSQEEIYNDLNANLVNVFRVLRNDARRKRLCFALEHTPYSRMEYIRCLALLKTSDGSDVERARAFFVCATFGYGGKDPVVGNRGNFTVNLKIAHSSRWDQVTLHIQKVARRFRHVLIESRDWLHVLDKHDGNDTFFYVDPPYVPTSRITARVYQHEMSEGDHERMVNRLRVVAGHVMLSGYPNDLYDKLLGDWRQAWFNARCSISGKSKSLRTEVVWMNYDRHGHRLATTSDAKGEIDD